MNKKRFSGLSSRGLHLTAMGLMLCDHLWATVIPGNAWLTLIGRTAFPIFAFLLAEGWRHTGDKGRYLKRMLLFAVLSEIPFNLMTNGLWIFPFQQNVLWTFAIALLAMKTLDKLRASDKKPAVKGLLCALAAWGFCLLAMITFTDYGFWGVATVLAFYAIPGRDPVSRLLQLAAMLFIHGTRIKGLVYPMDVFGFQFELRQQSLAVLGMLPICLYNGLPGRKDKLTRAVNYWFYPVHMAALWGLSQLL